jgi:maleate isomerase
MTSRDTLGWRRVFAVVGPSTNTVVEPEFAAMRPAGVTNQYRDIYIENARALSDEAFMAGAEVITGAVDAALRTAMTCEPDYLVMGGLGHHLHRRCTRLRALCQPWHELTGKQVSVGSVSASRP